MNAITTFAFDATHLRVIDRAGDPWFVAADVCEVLGASNPTMAVKALDDDERAKFNLGRQGDATIISESGLYTLILRSRDATTPGTVAHRFRRWVTAVVLPAIRRTGQFIAGRTFDQTDVPWMVATNNLLRTAMRMHGARAARPLWEQFGLPPIAGGSGALIDALDPLDEEEEEIAELATEWVKDRKKFTIPELAVGIGMGEAVPMGVKRKIGHVLRTMGFEATVERRGDFTLKVFRRVDG